MWDSSSHAGVLFRQKAVKLLHMRRLCFAAMFISAAACSPAGLAGEETRCPEQTAPVEALIERASAIVIAEPVADAVSDPKPAISLREIQNEANDAAARSAAKDRITAQLPIQLFTVIEYVKGGGPSEMSVTTAYMTEDFRGEGPAHDDPEFWKNPAAGRGVLTGHCGVAATFSPATRYLLFIGAPHVKAYEVISSENDSWLAYVRKRTKTAP